MGQHRHNPTAQAAKKGLIEPKKKPGPKSQALCKTLAKALIFPNYLNGTKETYK